MASETDTKVELAVLGAGTMGHGIALAAAMAGLRVRLHDIEEELLARALEQSRGALGKAAERGKVEPDAVDAIAARIETTTDLDVAVAEVDAVVEAVPERLELKRELFARLDERCAPDTVLATNTSSLSVTEVAAACRRPDRVVGMHFFNPPYILKLLELVLAEQTSPQTADRAEALGVRLGKEVVRVQDSPGFASSRLGIALGNEAMRMVQEGVASAEAIDRVMELGYRHPMGPLRLTDLVGLDVRLAISEYLYRELGGEQFRPPQILKRMVRAGKLGKKSGQGFYRWDD